MHIYAVTHIYVTAINSILKYIRAYIIERYETANMWAGKNIWKLKFFF